MASHLRMFKDFFHHIGVFITEFFQKEESWVFLFFLATAVAVPFFTANDILNTVLSFIALTWWFWIFSPLFLLLRAVILYVRQERFKRSVKTAFFELNIPREMETNPKAMEQILSTMQSLRSAPRSIGDKYFKGKVPLWFSFELVSFGGKMRFFMRVPEENKGVVEAAFFSYYTDVELVEVNDYMDTFPKNVKGLHEQDKEIWGTEYILAREEAYPIKTYTHFESESEAKQLDPISNMLEVLGKVRNEETVGIQILAQPADSDWSEKWENLLTELRTPKTVDVGKGEDKKSVSMHSPGHEETLKEVEKNLSKPAFETIIRIFYVSPKDIFADSYIKSGISGAFNQYSSRNFNAFKSNSDAGTGIGGFKFFKKDERTNYRKEMFFYNVRNRMLPPESWIGKLLSSYLLASNFASKKFTMNIEALATIFHPPASFVLTAPHMKRVESRKTGPQSGLDIFGEEHEIEKFK